MQPSSRRSRSNEKPRTNVRASLIANDQANGAGVRPDLLAEAVLGAASYRRMQLQDVCTAEDCLYVMAIIDLFSHRVVAGRWVQR